MHLKIEKTTYMLFENYKNRELHSFIQIMSYNRSSCNHLKLLMKFISSTHCTGSCSKYFAVRPCIINENLLFQTL